jgi:predicted TIM-barrel fold metal-dependent hydrolase
LDGKRRDGAAAFRTLPEVLELGKYPNVLLKVSSMPYWSQEDYPFRDLDDVVKQVLGAFGPKRLLWGTDLTRIRDQKVSYREIVDHFREGMTFLNAEEREWMLGKGLEQALNWPAGSRSTDTPAQRRAAAA